MKKGAALKLFLRDKTILPLKRFHHFIRRLFPFRKISWKLTLIYAGIFSIVLILLNACTLYSVRYLLVQQAKSQVQSSAAVTMADITHRLNNREDDDGSSENSAHTLTDPDLLSEATQNSSVNVRITEPDGQTALSSGRFRLEQIKATGDIGTIRVIELKDLHLVVLNEKISSGKSAVGYLQVAYEMHREYVFLKLLFILMAFADLCGMILSVLAGFFMSKRVLRPVDRMTRAAQQISISGLDRRIEVGQADDELTRLAVTFNQMIERLQTSFAKQNRFVSDASHELRTPISVIRGYADVIDRWGKNDPAVLQESIEAIRKETENMTTLIERLLFLARGDSGSIRINREIFGVRELLEEVADESRLLKTGHTLDVAAQTGLSLCADRRFVKQALRALIDNSIKYTPTAGKISLIAEQNKKTIRITVQDTGMGIEQEEIPNIFDRFYRVDKSRTREKGSGSGLGLSIVKWIAEVNNGSVQVKSESGQGTGVTLLFPAEK